MDQEYLEESLDMDGGLDMDQALSAHGLIRKQKAPRVEVRELSEDELPALLEYRGVEGSQPLKKVRDVHHRVARMVAAGIKQVDIAAVCGLHPNRICMLQDDPTFQELVAHYREAEKELWQDVREKQEQIGSIASEEIQDRLLDEPEKISMKDLLNIMNASLDRAGHGAVQKSQQVKVYATADQVARLKERSSESVTVRRPGERGNAGRSAVSGENGGGGDGETSRPALRKEGFGTVIDIDPESDNETMD